MLASLSNMFGRSAYSCESVDRLVSALSARERCYVASRIAASQLTLTVMLMTGEKIEVVAEATTLVRGLKENISLIRREGPAPDMTLLFIPGAEDALPDEESLRAAGLSTGATLCLLPRGQRFDTYHCNSGTCHFNSGMPSAYFQAYCDLSAGGGATIDHSRTTVTKTGDFGCTLALVTPVVDLQAGAGIVSAEFEVEGTLHVFVGVVPACGPWRPALPHGHGRRVSRLQEVRDKEVRRCSFCMRRFHGGIVSFGSPWGSAALGRLHHCRSCGSSCCTDCLQTRDLPHQHGLQTRSVLVCGPCAKKMDSCTELPLHARDKPGRFMNLHDGSLCGSGLQWEHERGAFARGDRIAVAVDCATRSLQFFRNGQPWGPGFPAGHITEDRVAFAVQMSRQASITLLPGAAAPAGAAATSTPGSGSASCGGAALDATFRGPLPSVHAPGSQSEVADALLAQCAVITEWGLQCLSESNPNPVKQVLVDLGMWNSRSFRADLGLWGATSFRGEPVKPVPPWELKVEAVQKAGAAQAGAGAEGTCLQACFNPTDGADKHQQLAWLNPTACRAIAWAVSSSPAGGRGGDQHLGYWPTSAAALYRQDT